MLSMLRGVNKNILKLSPTDYEHLFIEKCLQTMWSSVYFTADVDDENPLYYTLGLFDIDFPSTM